MDITIALELLSINGLGYFPASLLLLEMMGAIWSLGQIFVIHDPAHTFCMYFSNGKLN